MNFENDLSFFREILEKSHIHTAVLALHDNIGATVEPIFRRITRFFSETDVTVQRVFGNIEKETQYMLCNEFKLRYIYLRLPVFSERNILFIGPYLTAFPSSQDILEISEKLSLNPSGQNLLREGYAAVPIISENDRIFAVIDAFCERIWQKASFAIVKFSKNYLLPLLATDISAHGEDAEELLARAEMMEKRYAFENELIRAVSLGQQHKESLLSAAFHARMFEKRVQDPIRNAKNYCIIMNTLLRKAAEEGGVHPIHIDRLSTKIAAKIERIPGTNAVSELMREMFSSYCRLVRKHAMKQYSPIVKKAILVIDSDITADLTLGALASCLGVSCGYLATVFKKETGKTVSEYVRDRRMEHAKYLLNTTQLQIQTVALYCGIVDVQYFSKIFKKQTGKTPREYRETIRE